MSDKILSAPPLAILVPVVPAKDRILQSHTIEDRFDQRWGFYQVVINKETKQEWNVGRTYDFEGYVNKLNRDIIAGLFN